MDIKYPIKAAYTLKIESVVKNLSTDRHEGLSKTEASLRSKRFGLNIYKRKVYEIYASESKI